MKRPMALLAAGGMMMAGAAAAPKGDEVEEGLRDAFKLYQEHKYGEVSDKLRAIIKILEEKNADRVEIVLPKKVLDWEGGELTRENLDLVGGGLSMKRNYHWGIKTITVKLVKDSPLADQLAKFMLNEDLVKLSGKKVHTIQGEKAVMDNERKLRMLIDGEVLLEVTGNEHAKEMDVVSIARKLDVRLMKKMK